MGFEEADKYNGKGVDFIKRLAQSGVELIALHGRTREQMYHGEADTDSIAAYRAAIKDTKVPFIANGDIKDGASALSMFDKTDADGVMIGRAATGNPWVIRDVRDALDGKEAKEPPSAEERKQMLIRELELTMRYKDENIAVREMRPSMMAYIKGLPGAAALKVELCSALTLEEVKATLWK